MSRRALKCPAFLVAMSVLLASAAGMSAAIKAYGVYLRKLPIYAPQGRLLRALPAETAHWRRVGTDKAESAEVLEVLGTDNYVTRAYTLKAPTDPKAARTVELHAAYYTNQIDTVPHVPERCFTGAGLALVGGPWLVNVPLDTAEWAPHPDALPEEVSGDPAARVLSTRLSNEYSPFGGGRRVRLPRGLSKDRPLQLLVSRFADDRGNTIHAGYFFVANGGWSASANEVRTLAFSLTEDYAYYLKVQFSSTQAQSPQELAALAGSLLDDLFGDLMSCVPDWVEVREGRYPSDNPRRRDTSPR
jgi:hypothetical protein